MARLTLPVLVASGGGSGLLPLAPGTWGSLAALGAGALLLRRVGRLGLLAATAGATAAGLWAIPRAGGERDPGWVVIDEVAGQWTAMLALRRVSAAGLLAAFGLFRALDIAKPGPIGRVDRMGGPAAVMGDDLVAGAAAAALLWLARC